MDKITFKKSVHIAALGFDIERIVKPALEGNASRLYVIAREQNDKAGIHYQEISNQLKRKGIEVVKEQCDHSDLFKLLKKYRQIIETEKNNHIYINVSCGSKITAIAGMMAGMMFQNIPASVEPYYAKMKKYASEEAWEKKGKKSPPFQECTEYLGVIILDKYSVATPEKPLVEALAVLQRHSGKMRKKELLQELLSKKVIAQDEEGRSKRTTGSGVKLGPTPREYMALKQKIVRPLKEKWKAIEEEYGKSGSITITKKGENILTFLEDFEY